MHFFKDHVEEVQEGFKTLQEVCNQVLNSEKLLKVLQMVLNIGNLLNEGTLNGGVDAFKFESLSKLSQTKSAEGKTTVLDYIVETFISKGERDVLNLLTEFPDIQVSVCDFHAIISKPRLISFDFRNQAGCPLVI